MTVVETLVTCALLGILFSIVSMTLRPGLAAWRRSQVRGDLQGNALLAMHGLTQAMKHGRPAGVALYPRTIHVGDDDIAMDAVAVTEGADETPVEGSTAAVTVFYVQAANRELWEARFDGTTSAEGTGGSGIPPTAVTALESGQEVPPWVGKHRRVSRFLAVLRIEPCGAAFRVRVQTAEQGLQCQLESSVTPILEALGPPTACSNPNAEPKP